MKIEHLQGLISAPFAPFNANGKVDVNLIAPYYEFLKRNGVTGAFINGSTGEGVSITVEEKKAIAQAWADCSNHDADFKVMVFLGGTCLTDCIDLAKHAYEIGLYAVSLTAPFYFKPANVDMLAQACIAVGESVPNMPFYYYHIPVLTGVNLPMFDLVKALDGVLPNFAGIKYTHEDFMDFQSCMSYENGKFDMLWGRDENMLSALVLGAKGAVGSTFNYAAPLYYDLIDAFNTNDLVKARALQQKSIDMIRLLGKYGGISVGKAYMKVVGQDLGEFRLPVKNMSAEQFELFKKDVASLNFDEFKSK
ncbi:dihydrodipicolinate synthase family protein [Flavobacterium granuli]|uniref:N-acetylneuraminate lyase n=1 Tax=Flavobacterium granuli TaxID=280093 RepID=A0A1M5M3X8_9FLAO|nr:dihydrodipicolinate synthase family protein [Flavobacterium granuli]PRZ24202.1 N-acetylneuraminate lyase [Flavobacterium granuli]SHG71940.1 N-acetylneuraminate lyase [Flavobacterium granuli]